MSLSLFVILFYQQLLQLISSQPLMRFVRVAEPHFNAVLWGSRHIRQHYCSQNRYFDVLLAEQLDLEQESTKVKSRMLETLNLLTCANSSTNEKRHMSCVTCHLSPVTCHWSPATKIYYPAVKDT